MWSTARLGRNWALFFWIWLDIDDLQVETTIFTKFCKIKPNNEFGDFKAPWKWEKKEALRMWWISQNLSDLVKRSINLPFLHGCLVRGHPLIFLKWQFWRDILCTVCVSSMTINIFHWTADPGSVSAGGLHFRRGGSVDWRRFSGPGGWRAAV